MAITRREFMKLSIFSIASLLTNGIVKANDCYNLTINLPINTPPSLMIHSANLKKPYPLEELLDKLSQKFFPMTYKELAKLLQSNKKPEKISDKSPLIISIDDISPYWVNQNFMQIIKIMSQYNFYGTLGIVTQGYDVNKNKWELDRWRQNWMFFQELKEQGWELASHSRHHDNLPFSKRLKEEIIESVNDIITFGKYIPSTFILPFGNLTRHDKKDEENEIFVKQVFDIFRDNGIIFVVGIRDSPPNMKSKINGDVIIGESPFYVSRIPVVGKHGINGVIENIKRSFRY